jgi:Cdc6-like AAA superfamily ATPase
MASTRHIVPLKSGASIATSAAGVGSFVQEEINPAQSAINMQRCSVDFTFRSDFFILNFLNTQVIKLCAERVYTVSGRVRGSLATCKAGDTFDV